MTNKIIVTLGKVYVNGILCKCPVVELIGYPGIKINCIDEGKGIYEIEFDEDFDGQACLQFLVSCPESACTTCTEIIEKCFCDKNSDCGPCEVCINGFCESVCPPDAECKDEVCICEGEGCIECVDDEDCEDGRICVGGRCVCPPGTVEDEFGNCVQCTNNTDCGLCSECVGGKCKPKVCVGACDPVTGECVECANSGDCPPNECCQTDKTCDCCTGYRRDGYGKCVPPPECDFDDDCGICEQCYNGECVEKVCPDGQVCVNGECEEECDCNNPASCSDRNNVCQRVAGTQICICKSCGNCSPGCNQGCYCEGDRECLPDGCIGNCVDGTDCGVGCGCVNNKCTRCSSLDCTSNECAKALGCECVGSVCTQVGGCTGGCNTAYDCGLGCTCDNGKCVSCDNFSCDTNDCANKERCKCVDGKCEGDGDAECQDTVSILKDNSTCTLWGEQRTNGCTCPDIRVKVDINEDGSYSISLFKGNTNSSDFLLDDPNDVDGVADDGRDTPSSGVVTIDVDTYRGNDKATKSYSQSVVNYSSATAGGQLARPVVGEDGVTKVVYSLRASGFAFNGEGRNTCSDYSGGLEALGGVIAQSTQNTTAVFSLSGILSTNQRRTPLFTWHKSDTGAYTPNTKIRSVYAQEIGSVFSDYLPEELTESCKYYKLISDCGCEKETDDYVVICNPQNFDGNIVPNTCNKKIDIDIPTPCSANKDLIYEIKLNGESKYTGTLGLTKRLTSETPITVVSLEMVCDKGGECLIEKYYPELDTVEAEPIVTCNDSGIYIEFATAYQGISVLSVTLVDDTGTEVGIGFNRALPSSGVYTGTYTVKFLNGCDDYKGTITKDCCDDFQMPSLSRNCDTGEVAGLNNLPSGAGVEFYINNNGQTLSREEVLAYNFVQEESYTITASFPGCGGNSSMIPSVDSACCVNFNKITLSQSSSQIDSVIVTVPEEFTGTPQFYIDGSATATTPTTSTGNEYVFTGITGEVIIKVVLGVCDYTVTLSPGCEETVGLNFSAKGDGISGTLTITGGTGNSQTPTSTPLTTITSTGNNTYTVIGMTFGATYIFSVEDGICGENSVTFEPGECNLGLTLKDFDICQPKGEVNQMTCYCSNALWRFSFTSVPTGNNIYTLNYTSEILSDIPVEEGALSINGGLVGVSETGSIPNVPDGNIVIALSTIKLEDGCIYNGITESVASSSNYYPGDRGLSNTNPNGKLIHFIWEKSGQQVFEEWDEELTELPENLIEVGKTYKVIAECGDCTENASDKVCCIPDIELELNSCTEIEITLTGTDGAYSLTGDITDTVDVTNGTFNNTYTVSGGNGTTYTVVVKPQGSNDCMEESSITSPELVINTSCAQDATTWNLSVLGAGGIAITITTTNQGTISEGNILGIPTGNDVTFTVTNELGCSKEFTRSVSQCDCTLPVVTGIPSTLSACVDSDVLVPYSITNSGAFSYSVDGGTYQSLTSSIGEINLGVLTSNSTVTISFADSNDTLNCIEPFSIDITVNDLPTITVDAVTCNEGQGTYNANYTVNGYVTSVSPVGRVDIGSNSNKMYFEENIPITGGFELTLNAGTGCEVSENMSAPEDCCDPNSQPTISSHTVSGGNITLTINGNGCNDYVVSVNSGSQYVGAGSQNGNAYVFPLAQECTNSNGCSVVFSISGCGCGGTGTENTYTVTLTDDTCVDGGITIVNSANESQDGSINEFVITLDDDLFYEAGCCESTQYIDRECCPYKTGKITTFDCIEIPPQECTAQSVAGKFCCPKNDCSLQNILISVDGMTVTNPVYDVNTITVTVREVNSSTELVTFTISSDNNVNSCNICSKTLDVTIGSDTRSGCEDVLEFAAGGNLRRPCVHDGTTGHYYKVINRVGGENCVLGASDFGFSPTLPSTAVVDYSGTAGNPANQLRITNIPSSWDELHTVTVFGCVNGDLADCDTSFTVDFRQDNDCEPDDPNQRYRCGSGSTCTPCSGFINCQYFSLVNCQTNCGAPDPCDNVDCMSCERCVNGNCVDNCSSSGQECCNDRCVDECPNGRDANCNCIDDPCEQGATITPTFSKSCSNGDIILSATIDVACTACCVDTGSGSIGHLQITRNGAVITSSSVSSFTCNSGIPSLTATVTPSIASGQTADAYLFTYNTQICNTTRSGSKIIVINQNDLDTCGGSSCDYTLNISTPTCNSFGAAVTITASNCCSGSCPDSNTTGMIVKWFVNGTEVSENPQPSYGCPTSNGSILNTTEYNSGDTVSATVTASNTCGISKTASSSSAVMDC